ncbi:methyltransferase [Xylariaceae sp. FL0662B]|nr:methyltransferase [Xylariaceae sp. FL0662B]
MAVPCHLLPPTSSLPSLRSPESLIEEQVSTALRNLHALYSPLPRKLAFRSRPKTRKLLSNSPTPLADSGYASENEGSVDGDDLEDVLAGLHADTFERNFAVRWLTGFIARAEEFCLSSEDVRQAFIEDAASVLASLSDPAEEEEEEAEAGLSRHFAFDVPGDAKGTPTSKLEVQLNDDPLTGADHTDVGLQTWGASIVVSELLCATPARFGLTRALLGRAPRIVELGAGTGLVSLALGKLLPRLSIDDATVVATEYHPAVLANLRANIATNFPERCCSSSPVRACLLDWAEPTLDAPADMLVATDVVYAPEHAAMLRDCATRLLAPHGVFWLVATVRTSGKFEGISDTVEPAFAADGGPRGPDGRVLAILQREVFQKKSGVGRTDESGYKVFRIGWA